MAVAVEDALEALVEVVVAIIGDEVIALDGFTSPGHWVGYRKENLPKSCRDARLRQLQVILGIVEVLLAHT